MREPERWEPSFWVWGFIFLFLLVSLNIVNQAWRLSSDAAYDEALNACWDQFDADEPSDAVSVCRRAVERDFGK